MDNFFCVAESDYTYHQKNIGGSTQQLVSLIPFSITPEADAYMVDNAAYDSQLVNVPHFPYYLGANNRFEFLIKSVPKNSQKNVSLK